MPFIPDPLASTVLVQIFNSRLSILSAVSLDYPEQKVKDIRKLFDTRHVLVSVNLNQMYEHK